MLYCYCFLAGHAEAAAEENPVEEEVDQSPDASPNDFSSPNPDPDAPLLQAQQRPSSQVDREETRPGSETGDGKGGLDNLSLLTEKEQSEGNDLGDKDTADEGLPPSNGSEDESEEGCEELKEPSDANNNSIEVKDCSQDEAIDIPEAPAQVRHKHNILKILKILVCFPKQDV